MIMGLEMLGLLDIHENTFAKLHRLETLNLRGRRVSEDKPPAWKHLSGITHGLNEMRCPIFARDFRKRRATAITAWRSS